MEKQRLDGSIKFYSSNLGGLYQEYVPYVSSGNQKVKSRRSQSGSSGNRSSRTSSALSSQGNSVPIKDWINQKSLQRIREGHSAETFQTQKMYNTVLKNEENFVKGIDEFLKEHELLNIRQKELLYKRWQERVYYPLRKQIERTIESEFDVVDQQRRKQYTNYINYKNSKGDVFLDTISANEYDPLVVREKASLKILSPRLNDPLLLEERKRSDEDKLIVQCETGQVFSNEQIKALKEPKVPLVPLGRRGTNCSTWLAMPLNDIDSPEHLRSRHRMGKHFKPTSISFQCPSDPHIYRKLVDKELGLKKKKAFEVPSTMPSQNILEHSLLPVLQEKKVRFKMLQ